MVASDEGMRILKMLEQGQIDADGAAKLLEALGEEPKASSTGRGHGARWVKVRVTDTKTGRKKVNPIGMRMINKMTMAATTESSFRKYSFHPSKIALKPAPSMTTADTERK